jgi:hypothetical protein
MMTMTGNQGLVNALIMFLGSELWFQASVR